MLRCIVLHSAPPPDEERMYHALLARYLSKTDEQVLTDEQRTEIRVYRKLHGINSNTHLAALRKLGWSVDEYEVSGRCRARSGRACATTMECLVCSVAVITSCI
jgi:hypothetical protein